MNAGIYLGVIGRGGVPRDNITFIFYSIHRTLYATSLSFSSLSPLSRALPPLPLSLSFSLTAVRTAQGQEHHHRSSPRGSLQLRNQPQLSDQARIASVCPVSRKHRRPRARQGQAWRKAFGSHAAASARRPVKSHHGSVARRDAPRFGRGKRVAT
jgi:hypothetical protein